MDVHTAARYSSAVKTYRLRLLHISDLHVRGDEATDAGWRRRRVLGQEWQRNLQEIASRGPIDLVCFTGDLAQSGKAAEYAALTTFVDDVLAQTGVPRDRLFVVPGNHDVDRGVAKAAWKKLRGFGEDEEAAVSRWMATGIPPSRVRGAHHDEILQRQAAYRTWVRDALRRPDLLPDASRGHPRLGYRSTFRLPGWPFDVHVVGLDSAWLAGNESDARKLRLTTDQVGYLADGLTGFRLALVHHPLDDLADGDECRKLLASRVDLLLRGHLHRTRLSLWSEPNRQLREVATGCLYQHDQYPNACTMIEVELDGEGRVVLPYRLWFRGWSNDDEFWGDHDLLYRGSRQGVLQWPRPEAAPPRPPHPRVADVFAGRVRELAAMRAALLPAAGAPQAASAHGGTPVHGTNCGGGCSPRPPSCTSRTSTARPWRGRCSRWCGVFRGAR